ncbi:heterokaryon incompatibility protein-domain-containing protein [Cladorrhinum sp. PSN259]|nr:heterokaryon incompatibility protein-domain-containing protein [Cladorrhinum sp. PSN259]
MADSVPTYDGPSCHTCCDLMPNSQFPRPDGKWEDYRVQHQTKRKRMFTFHVMVTKIQKAASLGCAKCAFLIQALEQFEPTPLNVDDDFVTITGEIGKTLELSYEVDEDLRFVEIFSTGTAPAPLVCVGPGEMVEPAMTPSKAAKVARNWLDCCRASHAACRPVVSPGDEGYRQPALPKRLIRVGAEGETPRLIESSGEETEYMALSYCWGRSQTLLTTKSSLAARMREIAWHEIPTTLREAIEFTRELGAMYIWIDALCIIQDDYDDWVIEAAKMKDVYGNALLTLSATSAPDTQSGCFLPRPNRCCKLKGGDEGYSYYARRPCFDTHHNLFYYGNDNGDGMTEYPAMTRGWIFQERLLSKRMLYCAHDELLWECRDAISCECQVGISISPTEGNAITDFKRYGELQTLKENFEEEGLGERDDNGEANFAAIKLWLDLLESYSQRAFTRYTDKLVAIEGIAQKFQGVGLGTYVGGMWSSFMLQQLAWLRLRSFTRTRESIGRVPDTPTWSWASINQPCTFVEIKAPALIKSRFSVLSEITDRERLTVSAPAVAGTLLLRPKQSGASKEFFGDDNSIYDDFDSQMVFVTISGLEEHYHMVSDICQWSTTSPSFSQLQPCEVLHSGDEVICIELYQTADIDIEGLDECPPNTRYRFPWLVLRKTSSLSQSANVCYRRIGIIDFADLPLWWRKKLSPAPLIARAEIKVVDII